MVVVVSDRVLPALVFGFVLTSPFLMSTCALAGEGLASYYGKGFHGRRTASGQRFNQNSKQVNNRAQAGLLQELF